MEKLAVAGDVVDAVDFEAPIEDNLARHRRRARASAPTTSPSRSSTARATPTSSSACSRTGARIKFLLDGDVGGAILAADEGSSVDVLVGIGGTPEGVIAACAMKCLDGAIFGKLYPRDDGERQAALDAGYDLDKVLTTDDLVSGDDVFFAATGVTDGELLRGVRYTPQRVLTQSLSMRSKSGAIRIIEGRHHAQRSNLIRAGGSDDVLSTDVLVIGGGATGTGVAWDAALRGFDVVLVDRADLAEGTSGRFHGLLHSGGRYAVKDPHAAEECVAENAILREVAADCIEDTGGFFVTTPVRRPRLRRPLRRGLPGHGRAVRGDRSGAGAARGAAAAPRDLARLPRARRQHRRVEDGLGDGARRAAARRARAHLPRARSPCTATATRSRARACATSAPARRPTSRRASRSTRRARGPGRSRRWPASRASASSRAAGS